MLAMDYCVQKLLSFRGCDRHTLIKVGVKRISRSKKCPLGLRFLKTEVFLGIEVTFSLNNGWQFSSKGSRDANKDIKSWVQWDRPDQKFLRWNFYGPLFKGVWVPQNSWLQSWLLKNPDFVKKFPSVELSKISESSLGESFDDMSRKALEKIRDVLETKRKGDK